MTSCGGESRRRYDGEACVMQLHDSEEKLFVVGDIDDCAVFAGRIRHVVVASFSKSVANLCPPVPNRSISRLASVRKYPFIKTTPTFARCRPICGGGARDESPQYFDLSEAGAGGRIAGG